MLVEKLLHSKANPSPKPHHLPLSYWPYPLMITFLISGMEAESPHFLFEQLGTKEYSKKLVVTYAFAF